MKTRLLIIIFVSTAFAISMSYYAIDVMSPTVTLDCNPKYEQVGDKCKLLKAEQYCTDWCNVQELSALGCTEIALDFVYMSTNLFDEELGDVYYRNWIGLPDELSEGEFEQCENIIKEKRNFVELEDET